ncbi:MAG: aminotransferase class V-fold PLP-dependent enzyme [Acidimicrobiia bacterium]|nr:aminotransferase class V-fold PLP-dependent enzyme [Acidimicrobiia bacterium]
MDVDPGASLASAADHFSPTRIHLDSASYGLAPNVVTERLSTVVAAWAGGEASPPDYDTAVADSRQAYAKIVGCPVDWLAIATPVSVATGHAAALLQPGDTVLVAEEDFTSVLFPFLAREGAREDGGVAVRQVPIDELLDHIDPSIDMVAVSAVQSADGYRLDLDALAATARQADALTFVDITQAAGWITVDAQRFDMTAAGLYKWLCCPRGTGFFSVAPHLWDRMAAIAPGWYAGPDPWTSTYRAPFRQADNARRYDLSPAWLCWEGAAPALELLARAGPEAIGRHNIDLANRFRAGLGLEPSNTAIVSVDLTDTQVDRLGALGVNFASRAGRSRFSFHLYTTAGEVDTALDVINGGLA